MSDQPIPPSSPESRDEGRDGPPGESRGFFSRIIEALTPADPEAPPPRPAHGLGNLRHMRVDEVAVPGADVVAVPVTIPLGDLVETFRGSGRTRLPVHEGSLDRPLGLVNLKDVALRHGFGAADPFDLRALLRPLLYVPPSMPLAALLTRMQAERIHMALVIDEYGGVDGLVTIEDLLETVVGEIDDEHDAAEAPGFARESEGVWVVDGATELVDFERAIARDLTAHASIDPEEADTLGGLVYLLAGRVPRAGEVIEHPAGHSFEVLDSDPRRVRRLRVRL